MSIIKLSFVLKKKLPESTICDYCGVQGCATDHSNDPAPSTSAPTSTTSDGTPTP